MAVLTDKGIAPARASQALSLQSKVSETNLISRIRAALASSYAGVWFELAAARFHVGVTSDASRQVIKRIAAQAGLAAEVDETHVRSTWAALIAAQNHWNKGLAKLLVAGQVTTGIDSPHNALLVTLSSSISSAERSVLEGEATTANVNVLVAVLPPSKLRFRRGAKKNCIAPFVTKNAYCEEAITAGVQMETPILICTAGPMLVKGTETFMLTAGHCFGTASPKAGEAIKGVVASAYTEGLPEEVGKEGTWFETKERDMAEVKVKRPGLFTEPLPDPVPALMAEWVKEPKTPHAVDGIEQPAAGQMICHEGQVSGEECGEVKALNVTGTGTEHLVETNACSLNGDSGGPYFFRKETGAILMLGTEVGGALQCTTPPFKSYFEPLQDLEGAPGFGILSTFKQKLLTTANEKRKPQLKNTKGETLTEKAYTSKSGSTTLETAAGWKVTCSAGTGKGVVSGAQTGTFTTNFTGCEGFGVKCQTLGGAKEKEIVLSGKYKIVYINGSKTEVGIVHEFTETTIACGTFCPKMIQETLVLRGSAIGPVTPVNEAVVPPKVFLLAFSQAKGVQAPTEYENEKGEKVKAIIELEGSGSKTFGFEQSGVSDTDQLLFEETAELEGP
jgi:hypothetical protein